MGSDQREQERGAPNALPHVEHTYMFPCLFSRDGPQLTNPQGAAHVDLSRSVHVPKGAVGISKPFKEPSHMSTSSSA